MLPISFLSSGFAVGFPALRGFRSCPSQDVSVPGVGLKSLWLWVKQIQQDVSEPTKSKTKRKTYTHED